MATVDLINDIEPQHPYRRDKISLESLRAMVKEAGGVTYTDEYVDKLAYNDLLFIVRTHNGALPLEYTPPAP